jgi:hypothetical protein
MSPPRRLTTLVAASAMAASLALGGCAAPGAASRAAARAAPESAGTADTATAPRPEGSVAAGTARPPGTGASGIPPYLRVQAAQTGVAHAADDGRNVYLWFHGAVPDSLAVFDQDGRPLAWARAGAVAAVGGLHRGVLVRTVTGHSYLAPNPRADGLDRPSLDDDPQVLEARSRLEGEASQMAAFRRALARAGGSAVATGDGAPPGTASGSAPAAAGLPAGPAAGLPAGGAAAAPTAAAGLERTATAPPGATGTAPGNTAGAPATPATLPGSSLPALAADDPTFRRLADGSALVRLFFASGGRAIVRPDDGLARLEAEARGADEIRITGFTDSIGSVVANLAIAQARADAVRLLLLRRGVPPDRIAIAAVPAAQFMADNATEQGRALNRRVEVFLLRRPSR